MSYERTAFRGAYLVREDPQGVVMPHLEERVVRLVDGIGSGKRRLEKIVEALLESGRSLEEVGDSVWVAVKMRISDPKFSPEKFFGVWKYYEELY